MLDNSNFCSFIFKDLFNKKPIPILPYNKMIKLSANVFFSTVLKIMRQNRLMYHKTPGMVIYE